MINRRSLTTGLISFIAAPAIVKVHNVMPVKSYFNPEELLNKLISDNLPVYTGIDFGVLDMSAFYIHKIGDKVISQVIPKEEFYNHLDI